MKRMCSLFSRCINLIFGSNHFASTFNRDKFREECKKCEKFTTKIILRDISRLNNGIGSLFANCTRLSYSTLAI